MIHEEEEFLENSGLKLKLVLSYCIRFIKLRLCRIGLFPHLNKQMKAPSYQSLQLCPSPVATMAKRFKHKSQ
jgi:hypothetical protein